MSQTIRCSTTWRRQNTDHRKVIANDVIVILCISCQLELIFFCDNYFNCQSFGANSESFDKIHGIVSETQIS